MPVSNAWGILQHIVGIKTGTKKAPFSNGARFHQTIRINLPTKLANQHHFLCNNNKDAGINTERGNMTAFEFVAHKTAGSRTGPDKSSKTDSQPHQSTHIHTTVGKPDQKTKNAKKHRGCHQQSDYGFF
jgi:hypothetical protein